MKFIKNIVIERNEDLELPKKIGYSPRKPKFGGKKKSVFASVDNGHF
jgi:hypothetical protein